MKQKNELTSTYKKCEKEVQSLNRKLENLNQYLGQTQPDPVQAQQTKTEITAYKNGGESYPIDSTLPSESILFFI